MADPSTNGHPSPKWPNGASAAVSITMDNMGEANELERGLWPSDKPIGSHYSVTKVLPKMLDLLDKHQVHSTYFIEASNTAIYPDTIKEVAARGHEVAFHAWRHEAWSKVDEAREPELFSRSVKAQKDLGFRLHGFRPPGGKITPQTLKLMRENGFRYISPAATGVGIQEDIVILPFQWESIDAYFYYEPMKGLRKQRGDTEAGLSVDVLKERLLDRIDEAIKNGGYLSFLFHPFLHEEEERLEVMGEVLKRIKEDGRVWCAPCDEVARWVEGHSERFGGGVVWDDLSWR
jgi:peptidoglycan/xylan/chitin deacetylase (PgdA/CDA1 family)